MKKISLFLIVCICVLAAAACGRENKKPSGEAAVTPTAEAPTKEATPVPTAGPTAEPTAEPTPTPSPEPTRPVVPEGYSDAEIVKRIQEEAANAAFTYRREEVRTEGESFILNHESNHSNDEVCNRILSYYDETGKVKLERYLQDDREVFRRLIGEEGVCLMWDGNAVLEDSMKVISIGDEEHPSEKYETRGNAVAYHTAYTYYENGNPKEVTEQEYPIEGYGFERKETITSYDENGRILSIKETAQNFIEKRLNRYTLSEDGALCLDVTMIKFGKTAETVYEYDEEGNLLNKTILGSNDKELKESYTYEKDDKGRVRNIRVISYLDGKQYQINALDYEFLYYGNGPVLLRNKVVNPAGDWACLYEDAQVFLPGTELQKKLETCTGLSCEEIKAEINALMWEQESTGYGTVENALFTPNPYPVVKTFPKENGRLLLSCFGDYSGLTELKEFPMNKMWNEKGYEEFTWYGAVFLFDGDYMIRSTSSNGTGAKMLLQYDAKKRLKSITVYSDGTIVSGFQYDSAGRLTRADKKNEYFYLGGGSGGYKLVYTYDANGRLKKMTGELSEISYYESEEGSRTAMTVTIEPYTGNGEE